MITPSVYTFDHFGTTEAAEHWLAEVEVDFSYADAVQFSASLEAVSRGAGGAFSVRVGGTSRQADGVALLSLSSAASSSWLEGIASIPRAVSRGIQLFKLTASAATQNSLVEINAGSLTIWAEVIKAPLVFKMQGVDIYLGDVRGDGTPEYDITPNRDWRLVGEDEAYKQSLRRRFMTNPGEYKNKPDYGAGLSGAVKSAGTRSNRDGIAAKLKQQALADSRTRQVISVTVTPFATNGIEYAVVVERRGGDGTPLTVSDRIPGET
jgi:phage baseplate assembly protein W